MILRDYQQKAVNNIRKSFAKGLDRILLCSPTGSGKTIIFSEICRLSHIKGSKVLIITNRKELLTQSNNKLNDFGIIPEILNADKKNKPTHNIVVSMVETLNRRLKKIDYLGFIQSFDLVIIDEAHINCFNKIFDSMKENQRVLGVTATPYRTNPMPELKEFYDELINVCQVNELVENGFLTKPEPYGVPIDLTKCRITMGDYDENDLTELYNEESRYNSVIINYNKYAKNSKSIVFCASITNSKGLTQHFIDNGFESKHFDCYMADNERELVLDWFLNSKNGILCNVGILTTGFDCPDIETVILYRATKSLPLFLQMVGRGSRVTQNKNKFTILDFGNNHTAHGLWNQDRIWTLENPKKKKKTDVSPVKNCPNCDALIGTRQMNCPVCGFEIPKEPEKIQEITPIEAILQRLSPSEVQRFANDRSIAELEEIRTLKGYKVGWILHKLNSLEQYKEYEKLKNYKSGWAYWQWNNFKKINI